MRHGCNYDAGLNGVRKEGKDRAESIYELVVFANSDVASLLENIKRVLNGEDILHPNGLKWIAYHSQDVFSNEVSDGRYRVAVVAYSVLDLKRQLAQLIKMIEENPDESFSYDAAGMFYGFGSPEGKLAFLFPGQGAQYVRMGKQLAEIYPKSKAVLDKLGSFSFSGKTLNDVIFPSKARDQKELALQEETLAQPDWAMPAINLMSESIRVLLEGMRVKPDAVASHSNGDAASYCAAGVISPEQMIRFAGFRGVHSAACPMASKGGILMVSADPDEIRKTINAHNISQVWIANYNLPSLTVLSGVRENLIQINKIFTDASIKTKLLSINAAPHCPLSLRATNQFMDYIAKETFDKAICTLYSYLFGDRLDNDPDLYKKVISVSCLKPVRFVDQVNKMYADGIRTFIEIGPSDGLTKFVKRILGDKPYDAICTNKQNDDANYHFLAAVAELIKLGRIKDTRVLWDMYKAPSRPALAADNQHVEQMPDVSVIASSQALDRLKALDLQLSKINRMVAA